MELIDKAAVVAEIERRISVLKANESVISMLAGGMFVNEFKDLLSFLDTLEVKEEPVSKDLEEASKEWLRPRLDMSYINYGEGKMMELTHFDGYSMLDAIEFGANWQEEQMLVKMEQFLYEELSNGDIECRDMKFLIEYLKSYMKED